MSDNYDYSKAYLAHRVADIGLLNAVISNLQLNKEMRLLDFGCGTGNYLLALQEKGYTNLFALDIDIKMVEIATKRTGVIVRKGSHLSIPFENDFFDSVMLIAMIHFVDDLYNLFKNLYYVSKKAARVVIVTQSKKQIESRFYNKYFPSLIEIDEQRYHDPQSIITVAEHCGFLALSTQDYSSGTDLVIDNDYFNLINNKSFFVLRLLSNSEFNAGIYQFEEELKQKGGKFVAPFAGWTIITLQKGEKI